MIALCRSIPRSFPRMREPSTYFHTQVFHTQVIQKSPERRTLFPSPLAGEGDRAEAKPSEVGRGVIFVKTFSKRTPLPDRARYRAQSSLRRLRKLVCDAIHPLPQGERGSEFAARPYHLTLILSARAQRHHKSTPEPRINSTAMTNIRI